jgi:hypothetical protein
MIGIGYLVVSPALNLLLSTRATRIKNLILALGYIAILLVSSAGKFFSTCRGWYTVFPLRHIGVVLNSDAGFHRADTVLYPALVSLCIVLQLVLWAFIWWHFSVKKTPPLMSLELVSPEDISLDHLKFLQFRSLETKILILNWVSFLGRDEEQT